MTQSNICKVCGQPLTVHHLVMRWGVAHAAIYVDGRSRSCSEAAGDWADIRGRIQGLETIVRSLRWHAGRLRTKGAVWRPAQLNAQADKVARDIDRLMRVTAQYYAWARRKD